MSDKIRVYSDGVSFGDYRERKLTVQNLGPTVCIYFGPEEYTLSYTEAQHLADVISNYANKAKKEVFGL